MKKTVDVTFSVEVEVDENKFTDEFMNEFREVFYDFDDINDHIKYFAQLTARGIILEGDINQFIEGYGDTKEFGIKTKIIHQEEEINDSF